MSRVVQTRPSPPKTVSRREELCAVCLFVPIGKNKEGRIVIYNGNLPYHAEHFGIAHDLGHVFLGAPTQSDDREDGKEELKADAFASELLLPLAYLSANKERIQNFNLADLRSFSDGVFCSLATTATKLAKEKLITKKLRDEAVELSAQIQYEHYSPRLRNLFRYLREERKYVDEKVERFKELIDRGLSYHFVDTCRKAFEDDSVKESEIIGRCADIFSVPESWIRESFEMYSYIDENGLPTGS